MRKPIQKNLKCVAAASAALLLAAAPAQALAASPEFARSEEEWTRLRDNVLEYGELAGLIREYNVTVQNNAVELDQFKKDYGKTRDDIAKEYRDMADEIRSNLEYPDTDDLSYAAVMASIVQQTQNADALEKQADELVEDSEVHRLTYASAEASLVSVAQTNMISYHQYQYQLDQAQSNRETLQALYDSAVSRAAAGTATQMDVLTALQDVQTADKEISDLQSNIINVRQKLQVMTGWRFDDTPEISSVPQPDVNRIAAMDPIADAERARANNYTLLTNKRKLENAQDEKNKTTLTNTIRDNEEKIGSSLVTSYQNVLMAKAKYDQAAAEAQLAAKNLAAAGNQLQAGTITPLEYKQKQNEAFSKQQNFNVESLSLLQAMETYDWAVNGLASTQ